MKGAEKTSILVDNIKSTKLLMEEKGFLIFQNLYFAS